MILINSKILVKTSRRFASLLIIIAIVTGVFSMMTPINISYAASTRTLNPFDENFQLSTCDGPKLPDGSTQASSTYVPCDFKGLMDQIQFLINAMIMLGVLAAVVSFSYGGFLYLSGQQAKITHAKDIFKKTGLGFLMMLSAWFIVYQILSWLSANEGVKALLGS